MTVVAPIMNLFYLLSLPTTTEQLRGLQRITENEKVLLKKIFAEQSYDHLQPPGSPTEILSIMFIDHIEQLDQQQQVMSMHCSISFQWNDPRIVWEPRDYGNVEKITRSKSDFGRMWFPAIHFTEIKMRSDQAMQYYNTEVTIMYNGAVYVQVSLSIRSTCLFDFSAYPHDEQTCLLTMFTPLPLSRLKFSTYTSILTSQGGTLFGTKLSDSPLRSGEFIVHETNSKPLYILPFGRVTENITAARPSIMRSIVRYEIHFQRVITTYLFTIVLPLLCVTIVTFVVATIPSTTSSILWLLLCLAIQLANLAVLLMKIPPDQPSPPICAIIAAVVFVETFFLLIYRLTMNYLYTNEIKTENQKMITQRIEFGVRTFLLIEILLVAWLLR
ncbi:hypothetical protein AB6A40_001065 [Gnathostoma spinigerum]|uniref:Neurotransmitter-gated ion-channel ligand-binding domain-containing protein n=1 Tax=Gnathostoma spinigerum TaxID=75299 RepID=A0ABD6E5J3_9BILA